MGVEAVTMQRDPEAGRLSHASPSTLLTAVTTLSRIVPKRDSKAATCDSLTNVTMQCVI